MPSPTAPLIVSPGEPAGVGVEITGKAWLDLKNKRDCAFALIGDIAHIAATCRNAGIAAKTQAISDVAEANSVFPNALPVLHRPLPYAVTPGHFSKATAAWVTRAIEEAVDLCLAGTARALVTNPIQKEALYAAGFAHQGHTDFLAALCNAKGHAAQEVMMLVGEGLRAVPVTVHIPIKDVPQALTFDAIVAQATVVHSALRDQFKIKSPRVAVSGLNPHAGENGSIGREEIEIIRPAIAALQAKGVNAFGPLPADTAFFSEARAGYDAILCMYHDQALIPVKTLDFHGGVNVTLGLPIVRTSPDHGTALNLAGTGKAQAESLKAAIRLAAELTGAP